MAEVKKSKQPSSLIKRPLLAGAVAATAISAGGAQAALVDVFLKITGPEIPGESADDKHKNEIDVLSFQSSFALGKDATILKLGKPSCGPIEVTKTLDRASGPLVDALMKSTVLSKAVFTFKRPGKDQVEFYVVTLTNANVTSHTTVSEGNVPGETVDFLARNIEVKYTAQNSDGSVADAQTTSIDCAAAAK